MDNVLNIFSWADLPYVYPFLWSDTVCCFLIGLFVVLLLNFESSFQMYILVLLSDMWFTNIFLPPPFFFFCCLSFYPVSRVFYKARDLVFMMSSLSVFVDCFWCLSSKKTPLFLLYSRTHGSSNVGCRVFHTRLFSDTSWVFHNTVQFWH